jgi:hypothetical protein
MFAESMRGTNGSNAFDANDAGIELLRAVGLCHPGWMKLRGVTFAPEGFSSPEWLRWKEGLLTEVFLPRIEEARSASAAGNWQALVDCDRAIDSALPSGAREPSLLAGRVLVAHNAAPKCERLLVRYHELVGSGTAPGHLAVLCALRGAIFHLCPTAILAAYVFLEAKGGMPASGIEQWMSMVDDCLAKKCCPNTTNLRAA